MAYGKRDEVIEVRPNPWQEREEKRYRICNDYFKRFEKSSPLMPDAVLGGWDYDLLNYVKCVAWVQAQMIHPGGAGIGFDGMVIFGGPSKPDQRRVFFSEQKLQADMGYIDVGVPTGMMEKWKLWAKRQPFDMKKPREIPANHVKTSVDLEIERQMALANAPG